MRASLDEPNVEIYKKIMTPLKVADVAGPDNGFFAGPRTLAPEELRLTIESLCIHMEYLQSWWDAHETLIRSVPGTNAGRAYDNFVEGVICARILARETGLSIDRTSIAKYDWNACPWNYTPEVGPPAPIRYLGGTLGLGGSDVLAEFKTPNGSRYWLEDMESILEMIDLVAEPGRTQLLAGAAMHFDLCVDALMGPIT